MGSLDRDLETTVPPILRYIKPYLYLFPSLFRAAFECMYTLLDSCLDRIDIYEFLKHIENGLNDHYDIKMLTYLMLVRLSYLCPSALLECKSYRLICEWARALNVSAAIFSLFGCHH